MHLDRLHLRDIRNHASTVLDFAGGLTVLVGPNGQGKTNVLEAIGWLANLRSFRGAGPDVIVRTGSDVGVIRAEGHRPDGREVLVEAELAVSGRNRVQVDRRRLGRARDLVGVLRTTVFTPEDLAVVKAGPQLRRELLDDALIALDPRHDTVAGTYDRVLRQRNALLRQLGGRLSADDAITLDVWDERLVEAGERIISARTHLVAELAHPVEAAYLGLAPTTVRVAPCYRPSVDPGTLAQRLGEARRDDVRRGTTTVGPHRDDLDVLLDGRIGRTHASQGEQRSLALALKLAVHRLVTERVGRPPVLLLDDVFSELDPRRAAALVEILPAGQTVLTTAEGLPPGAVAERTYEVRGGTLTELS